MRELGRSAISIDEGSPYRILYVLVGPRRGPLVVLLSEQTTLVQICASKLLAFSIISNNMVSGYSG